MYDITDEDVEEITAVARLCDPAADLTRLGAWGIYHFVCGARAGLSKPWYGAVIAGMRLPTARDLAEHPDPPHGVESALAETLADQLSLWLRNPGVRLLAARQLGALPSVRGGRVDGTPAISPGASGPASIVECAVDYVALATYLNSCVELDTPEFAAVRAWAEGRAGGWPILFFAAGLLVSRDRDVRWERLARVLLAMAGPTAPRVRALLASFKGHPGPAAARRAPAAAGRLLLVNPFENLVRDVLHLAAEPHGASVWGKVRVKDVLAVEGSGLSDALYGYAFRAHFDFVVADHYSRALFAVEFDEPHHVYGPSRPRAKGPANGGADAGGVRTARNDRDKRAICEALGFPLLRIGTQALKRVDGTRPVLAWLVDRWFAERDAAGRPRPARPGPAGGDVGPFATDYATVHSAYAGNALADGGPDVHRFVRQARYAEVVVVARRARGGRVFGRARVREFGVFAGLAAADLAEMFAWRELAAALAVGLPPDPASERTLDRLLARPTNA